MDSTLANEYRERVRKGLGSSLGADQDTAQVSDTLVAICFAKDLMKGDPATFKAGYTAENAALAAHELYPDADVAKLEAGLGLREAAPEPKSCQVCGAPTSEEFRGIRKPGTCKPDLCERRVVVVETHIGHYEQVEHLIAHPVTLTADHIELTVRKLVEHACENLNPDVVLVADATGWQKADEWLAHDTYEKEAERRNRALFGG